jgi:hypothetical protein
MLCSALKGIGITVIFLWFACALPVHAQVNFTSSNLPIIVINTNGQQIVDEPKITASMGIIDNGPGNRNNLTDPFNNYNGKIGIEIRGSSSQMFPKKQYGIELRDEMGNDISLPLLGMPAEEDWVLFAPYNDKSLMRDALAYRLGRQQSRYAPRTRFCEVVLNDEYMGVYVLIEKIKRDKNRVDINKLDPDEVTGNNLTGGYIIKIDKMTGSGGDGWVSAYPPPNRSGDQTIFFQYEVPKATDIVIQQKNYIQGFMKNFEDALFAASFANPGQGYSRYIDVESFIDYWIVNEVSKNADAYRLSTFMYKHRDSDGGKLHMGPIWDFNLAFGNVNYCTNGDPEKFVTSFNTICPQDWWLIPFWWNRLMEDPDYRNNLVTRWNQLRSGPYQTARIHQYIDSVYTVLNQEAQQRNFQRWPVLGEYVWPNYYIGQTYQQEVTWLKNWIAQRMEWLDANIPLLITSIEDDPSITRLQIYPNPAQDVVHLTYIELPSDRVRITVRNQLGDLLMDQWSEPSPEGVVQEEIQLYPYSSGLYFLTLQSSSGVSVTRKIIKQ